MRRLSDVPCLATLRCLVLGLLVSGLAMQWTKTSRVASGADHQFSHLWDMEHHTPQARAPAHGLKVGMGTLVSTALYECLLTLPLALKEQLHKPVRWAETVRAMLTSGVTTIVECGPGKVLTALNKRIERRPGLTMLAVEDPDGLAAALAACKGGAA